MDWKKTIKIPGYYLGVQLKIALKKREGTPVLGIYNKIGHQYVPFLDYDDIKDNNLLYEELRSLQESEDLGNAYLFRTARGYHVIFTDLLPYDEWIRILNSTSCDSAYKSVPTINGQKAWVLRVTDKKKNSIKFENVLYNPNHRWQSMQVIELLKKLGVPKGAFNNVQNTIETSSKIVWAEYQA